MAAPFSEQTVDVMRLSTKVKKNMEKTQQSYNRSKSGTEMSEAQHDVKLNDRDVEIDFQETVEPQRTITSQQQRDNDL